MSKKSTAIINYLRAFINYKMKKIVLTNPPLTFWVEPTNVCNLKCVMCPNQYFPKDKLGFMSWDTFIKIIDQIKGYATAIELLFAGESLLHKDLFEMVKYAKSKNIQVILSTNGVPLSKPGIIDKILESGIDRFNIAFDGYNAQTYEKIRVGAKFDVIAKSVIKLLEEKKKRKLKKPYMVLTVLEVGLDDYLDKNKEKAAFFSMFDGLPMDEYIIKQPNTFGGYFKGTEVFKHQDIHKSILNPCSHLWSSMSICWDGSVVPCCFDFTREYILGNIHEKPILEIWNDEPMVKLRKGMFDGNYLKLNKLCDKCVLLHTKSSLGIPAGMRSAMRYTITKLVGFWIEKYLIKFTSKVSPDYALKILDK